MKHSKNIKKIIKITIYIGLALSFILSFFCENIVFGAIILTIIIVIAIIEALRRAEINQEIRNIQREFKEDNKETSEKTYQKKPLMTSTELRFCYAIKQSLPPQYILQAQANLATVIERTDEHKYQNELFRNIDFAIFNNKYEPILLIEINDKTHNEKARIARDYKVKDICQAANLPLITFWTDYGVNQEYIQKRISEYCN